MADKPAKPGDDRPVAAKNDLTVVSAVAAYKVEADNARKRRMSLNRMNRDAYMGIQDWDDKNEGQSTEFIPAVPTSVEQLGAFIKRALTQFGDWFTVDLGKDGDFLMRPDQVKDLLQHYFDRIPISETKHTNLSTIISDGVKLGALESLMIFKVHGRRIDKREFYVEPGESIINEEFGIEETGDDELKTRTTKPWRLVIEGIRSEDYYPDPSGMGLYEIHESEKDLHDVIALAMDGVYDEDAVANIIDDHASEKIDERTSAQKGQDDSSPPAFRKKVQIAEFWGTILDEDGEVVHRNITCTVANDKYLIRKPVPNPFWHQKSPFVAGPLIRVAFSVWHKALYDHASPLNFAMNELFNLMLDGGIASVWGVRQIRDYALTDPSDVSGGIPQGTTLSVNENLPIGGKVIEQVTEGEIPPDAMAMYTQLGQEFNQSALTNELKLGQLPGKQVKATEVVEASQSQAVTLDAMAKNIEENVIEEVISLAWLLILQFADDLDSDAVVDAIGERAALALTQMSAPQRYVELANLRSFKVSGLSATLGRVRDFQKTMAMLQAVRSDPILFQAFQKRFSGDKTLTTIMKQLNINPEGIEKDEEELANADNERAGLAEVQQLLGGKGGPGAGGAGPGAADTGDPSTSAQINQEASPATGLAAGGQ